MGKGCEITWSAEQRGWDSLRRAQAVPCQQHSLKCCFESCVALCAVGSGGSAAFWSDFCVWGALWGFDPIASLSLH